MQLKLYFKRIWLAIFILVIIFAFPLSTSAQTSVDLAVHFVEGKPAKEQIAYDVNVYLSVVDSAGNPIKDLTVESFTVSEDSQQVEIESVDPVSDEPINLVLVLDISGTMSGPGIASAKEAASNFIAGLQEDDRVAVITFNDEIKTIIDYTTDHQAARDQIALVDAKRNAGTCLYDAAYQAVQMSASLPSGRRAVVLLTDGVDEKADRSICSKQTEDDVINLASADGTRVPIFALGLGSKINENSLGRQASTTGGRYLHSPESTQLGAMFNLLADLLRSQYILRYTSVAGPGAHTLAVSANHLNATDNDTRNFLLPAMPTRISLTSLEDGQAVSGIETIEVDVAGGGELVESVAFQVNGKTVGTDTTTPYEQDVDFSAFEEGDTEVTVIVYGTDDVELAKESVTVTITDDLITSTPTPPGPDNPPPPINWGLWGGILGFLLIIAGVVVFFVLKQRREEKERDQAWENAQSMDAAPYAEMDDRTIDDWEPSTDALAMLTVENSDDPSLIGQRFEITKALITLGRSADNDILFPKDSPVSRYHAKIEERDGGLFLSEVESTGKDGSLKTPTFGTFLNDEQLSDPILLESNDEIRLGKRVRLRFEAAGITAKSEELTYDGFMVEEDGDDDSEKTQDIAL
ncbi:MAG: VWA domain-containing protein [Anaerolineae bacterium]|nr:VWA domain-containing protein [Anaerolineae bacterium]